MRRPFKRPGLCSRRRAADASRILPSILKQKGVSILLAGNMGDGAMSVLQRHGIEVHRGCSGDAGKAVEAFVAGEWKDSGMGCSAHHSEPGHQCPSHQ